MRAGGLYLTTSLPNRSDGLEAGRGGGFGGGFGGGVAEEYVPFESIILLNVIFSSVIFTS